MLAVPCPHCLCREYFHLFFPYSEIRFFFLWGDSLIYFLVASVNVHAYRSSLLSPKCVKVARPTLFGYVATREEFEYYTNELFSFLKSGKLKTKIYKIYPLEDVQQAHKVRSLN